ncbi:MAG: hypothetical protein QMD78_03105, partial [Methanocellales archaeon]|nr:hypothetical protein [Methanocellales archaeon]
HLLVLEEVHEKAPDAAKLAIERAMNVSARGQEEALKAPMKTSPERAEEIEREMPEDVRTIRERVNITPEATPSPSPSPSPTGANETEGRGG